MGQQNHILVVDDNEMNRAMLADMLSSEYKIIEAVNGREAIEILCRKEQEISLVLLDIVMPEMDGFEVLAMMNKLGLISRIPVVMISAENSSTYIDHAYDLGAADYISRPFDTKAVQRRVLNTLMLYAKQQMLENMVAEQIVEKEKNSFLMVEILSNIVEFRNGESGLHVLHIRVLTELFLRKLKQLTRQYPLSVAQMALIVNASALHDVGEISIPEQILNKPGRLTKEEFEIMKTHSALGAKIMEDALERHRDELLQYAYNICRWHHERYDGKGYPDGLRGDEIPIEAQVVALADVYDALTSVRVYKQAYSHEDALRMILAGECGVFHPLLLRCLKETALYLEKELRLHSLSGASQGGLQQLSSGIIANGGISSRTLMLLEQERTKCQFFASMSNEIQFEYSYKTDILTISESGTRQLGLPSLIEHPKASEALHQLFPPEKYSGVQSALQRATPENPVVSERERLLLRGEERRYKVTVRPIFDGLNIGVPTMVIGKLVDIHEDQLRVATLKRPAGHDFLTGLFNHASAQKRIRRLLSQRRDYVFVLLNLDDFKGVNNQGGRMFGTQILMRAADKIQAIRQAGDIAARIGGDEILMFMQLREDTEAALSRILKDIRRLSQEFEVSACMGASLSKDCGADYDKLFHMADQALHVAKKKGRGCCLLYDKTMKNLFSTLAPTDN